MKEKTNKKLAFVLAGALCAAIAVPAVTALTDAVGKNFSGFNGVYGGQTFTAFAEDAVEEPTVTYTMQTKGMYSLNNDYLLLTTNIDDVTQYQEVGYTVSLNGGEGVDQGSEKYYDSITFKTDAEGGTRTDAMADIFADNVVTGMIVTEIEYSEANNYSITPYMITNDDVRQEGKTVTVGKVSVTLELPENFTVDGYVSDTVSGRKLVLPTEEQITNNTGKAFVGWYDYETGAEVTAATTVTRNMTIAPYFAFDTGLALQPCYGYDNATQPDYVGTYEGTTFTHWTEEDGVTKVSMSDVFVSPAQVSYAGGQKGVMIQSQAGYSFKQNDAFRVKTASNPGMDGVITYEIFYTLTNYGKETLDFHVYQIMSQTNLTTATDLGNKVIAPGATITFSVNVKSKNNNLMTMFVFNQAVSGINMKMDMSMQGVAANISFDLLDGIEIADDYNTARHQGETLVLPTAEQIKNSTQYDVIGWTYADGTPANEGDVLKGDVVLKPVLSKDATISFNLPSGIQISDDYVTAVRTGDGLVLPTPDQITNTTGKEIVGWTYADGSLAATGDTIEGDIVLVPVLGEDAVITVKLPDGLTLSGEYATTQTMGKTLVLPTAEQIEGVPADDREILGWYNVATGEIIGADTVIEDTALTIAPYWTRQAGTATLQNAADSTANGNPLVFCNEQGNLRPAQIRLPGSSSNQTQADWFDPISGGKWVNDTVIEGGEGGYAELGNVVSMVSGKTMEAGMVFRCATVVSGSSSVKVVPVNEPITFYYNFQNFGDSAIHMTMWGVNSGIDYEGEGQTIDLEPGESTTIEFTVTYTKGSDNANIMAFFRVEEAITDMQLGASVNVVLP